VYIELLCDTNLSLHITIAYLGIMIYLEHMIYDLHKLARPLSI